MKRLFPHSAASLKQLSDRDISSERISAFLFFVLFAGIAAGAVVGVFSPPDALSVELEEYAASLFSFQGLPDALLVSSRFLLLLLLTATSFLGIVLVPLLLLIRGYLLSCSAAAMYALFSFRGLLWSFLLFGLPALWSIPCFFLCSCDAFRSSRQLLRLRFGYGDERTAPRGMLRHILVLALMCGLDAIYEYYMIPLLFSTFFNI